MICHMLNCSSGIPLLIFFDNCMYSTYAIFFYLLQNSFLYDKECRNRIWRKLLSSKNQWCNQMGMKWNWFFSLFIDYKKLAMCQVIIGIVRCIRFTFKIQLLVVGTQKRITPKFKILQLQIIDKIKTNTGQGFLLSQTVLSPYTESNYHGGLFTVPP